MTTESRRNAEEDLEENMRRVGETAVGKVNKDEKATASGASEAAGFSLPFGLGKKKKKEEEAKAEAAPTPTPTPTPTPAPPPATEAPAPKAQRTYTVKAGDTLWDIAVSYYGDGQQYRKIARANNIADPNLINIGVTLIIPE